MWCRDVRTVVEIEPVKSVDCLFLVDLLVVSGDSREVSEEEIES